MGSPKVIEPHKPPKASEYFLKKSLLSSLLIKFHLFLTSPNSTVHYLFTEVSFFFVQKYLSILSPWAQPLPLFHVNFPIPFSAVSFQSFFFALSHHSLHYPAVCCTILPLLMPSHCSLFYPAILCALCTIYLFPCPVLESLSVNVPSHKKDFHGRNTHQSYIEGHGL